MRPSIVFFDAGETLLHPYPSFPALFVTVAGAHGYAIDVQAATEVQARLAPHLVELAEETGITNPSLDRDDSVRFWGHLYRRLLAEFGIEDEALVTKMYATFSSTSSYRLFDDVLPTLEALEDAGFRLGLISNFEEWLAEMLVELEIGHRFEVSLISGIEGVEKPDPDIYRRALEKAGVDASAAVHVGDSPSNDVDPSASVGIRPILIDRYDRYGETEVERITQLTQLVSIL